VFGAFSSAADGIVVNRLPTLFIVPLPSPADIRTISKLWRAASGKTK
jgi:hypothetical protein